MVRSMSLNTISRRTILGAASAAILSSFLHGTVRAQEATFPFVVDLDWLRERSSQAGLRLFDVSPLHVYRDRHIDSAEHAWWRDTVDPNYPVFGAVLTQGDEQRHRKQVLDSLGLYTGEDVVVYDDASGFRAARLVWFLRFLGFGRAALLNASFADWQANEFPIDSASSTSSPPVVDPQPGFYLVTEQLLSRLSNPEVQVIDIRTDAERADDLDGQMPQGQIPGSIQYQWTEMLAPSGHLLPAADLQAQTASLGLDTARETVLYGNFGVDTALSWIALRQAGFQNLLSYDRGWAEWSITPGLPREPLA